MTSYTIEQLTSRRWAIRAQLLATALMTTLCWSVVAVNVQAQYTDSFITLGSKGRDVLAVTTQCSQTASGGVGTANVTIASTTGPSQSERRLQVVFYIRAYENDKQVGRAVRRSVTLGEDQTFVEVDVPYVADNSFSYDVEVFEDRRNIEDERSSRKRTRNSSDFNLVSSVNAGMKALVVLANPTEVRLAEASGGYRRLAMRLFNTTTPSRAFQPIAQDDFPDDWRMLLDRSLVVISAPLLERIRTKAPRKASAIKAYVSAGGRLVVYSEAGTNSAEAVANLLPEEYGALNWEYMSAPVDTWWSRSLLRPTVSYTSQAMQQVRMPDGQVIFVDPQQAANLLASTPGARTVATNVAASFGTTAETTPDAEIEKSQESDSNKEEEELALGLRGVAFDAAIATESVLAYRGKAALNLFDDTWRLLEESAEPTVSFSAESPLGSQLGKVRGSVFQSLGDSFVRKAEYAAGHIVLLSEPPLTAGSSFDLPLRSLMYGGVHNDLARESDGDWGFRNIIRAVGKPPVWRFCVAVALFAALLGPGLLFLTARMQRRSLMLLFVPAVSLIATLSIVAYGVIHEGFGTYLRTVSIQWVDAKTQDGFAWSRQNYFSGAPSSDGLEFEADTYVRSVQLPDSSRSYTVDPREDLMAEISLDGDKQVWRRWLRARNQQQLLVGHRITDVQVPLKIERIADGKVKFSNVSEQVVKLAVTRDNEDLHYVCEELLPGASEVVEGGEKAAVLSQVTRLWADIRPTPPPELRVGGGSLLSFGRNRFSIGSSGNDMLNDSFKRYLSDDSVLPLGTAVVVVGGTDCLELPIDGEQEESVHVIIGGNVW